MIINKDKKNPCQEKYIHESEGGPWFVRGPWNADSCRSEGEGVKYGGKYANVLYGWPLSTYGLAQCCMIQQNCWKFMSTIYKYPENA